MLMIDQHMPNHASAIQQTALQFELFGLTFCIPISNNTNERWYYYELHAHMINDFNNIVKWLSLP